MTLFEHQDVIPRSALIKGVLRFGGPTHLVRSDNVGGSLMYCGKFGFTARGARRENPASCRSCRIKAQAYGYDA